MDSVPWLDLLLAVVALVVGFLARHFGHLLPWLKDLLAKLPSDSPTVHQATLDAQSVPKDALAGFVLVPNAEYEELRRVYLLHAGRPQPPVSAVGSAEGPVR